MSAMFGRRAVNPRLGTYFGIFASAFTALTLLVLVFEQLGSEDQLLRAAMLLVPFGMYIVIGLGCRSTEVLEFFASGRRVPAVNSGAVMSVTALGGTGIVALTGLFFIHGFDAWCIGTGVVAGFVVMGVAIAPFLRKFGGFTVASYLGRRFDSRLLRIVAAALLTVAMLLFLAAEMSVAAAVGSRLSGQATPYVMLLMVVTVAGCTVPGGLRSATWTLTAAVIVVVLAIMVPAGLMAVLAGNLPVPQLSHGPTLRALGVLERSQGLPLAAMPPLAMNFAGTEMTAMAQRFASPFGSVGPIAYVLAALTTMAGVAVAPWLLPRIGTTPGIYETRKSAGWATVFAGVLLLTLSAFAVFMRDMVMEQLTMREIASVPAWFATLVSERLAAVGAEGPRLAPQSVLFARDGVLFALPIAAGFPDTVLYMTLAGALAAALAGAVAATTAIAHTVGEDIVAGTSWEPLPDRIRIYLVRIAMIVIPICAAVIAASTKADPFKLALWALALSGSTAFPVVILSIWWKRIDEQGALASMVVGFFVAVLTILLAETTGVGLSSLLAGVFGIPAATLVALGISAWRGAPGKPELELVMDIRIPGGETLYDRDTRRQRQKQRQLR